MNLARRRAPVFAAVGVVVLAFAAGAVLLQPGGQSARLPGYGPTVLAGDTGHDTSPPLLRIPPAPWDHQPPEIDVLQRLPGVRTSSVGDSVVQRAAPVRAAPTPSVNVDGVGNGFAGPNGTFTVNAAPPDTNAAVGPSQVVEIVNTGFAVMSKSGTVLYGPVATNTLWSGFGGLCQSDDDGDGTVKYDQLAGRWIISQFAISNTTSGYLDCVAVSQTSDATGAWYRYAFSFGSQFPDYPKIAVWPDAYYATFNMYNSSGTSFLGGEVCAYDRTAMLAGLTATMQCFNVGSNYGGLLVSDVDGSTQPSAGEPAYVVSLGAAANQLAVWRFHVDWEVGSGLVELEGRVLQPGA